MLVVGNVVGTDSPMIAPGGADSAAKGQPPHLLTRVRPRDFLHACGTGSVQQWGAAKAQKLMVCFALLR